MKVNLRVLPGGKITPAQKKNMLEPNYAADTKRKTKKKAR